MATGKDDDTRDSVRGGSCAECGAACSDDQRYCIECGARRGDLPPAIAARIASLLRRDRGEKAPGTAEAPGSDEAEGTAASPSYMPSPRAAAVAVMGMLALGVLLGSATSQVAQSAGLYSILLEVPTSAPQEEPEETATVEPEEEPEAAPVPATESSIPYTPVPIEESTGEPEEEELPELPEEVGLPEVKHLFLIMLGDNGYEETFGALSPAPYLTQTLPEKGELLSNYYAVTQGSLANQIALVSGQGPTPETAANCPNYADVLPGTTSLEGQVEGNGCVYPAETETLASQLVASGLKWKAYIEDIGNGAASGQPATCRHPALGTPDLSQVPVPGDAYETWRNPFVYFHSIIDAPECAESDVGLDRLGTDLKAAKKTPTLSYIVPNACHSGGEVPCEPGQPTGALAVEAFLRKVVPPILASAAYKEGGLIAITSAQAPQTGEKADPSSCCVSPAYPNLPVPPPAEPVTGPVKPTGGGGRVGMLLLSPFVEPGSVNETGYFNHYTLLLTIEELFRLEKLGYANEIALTAFDSTVFNAEAK